MSTRTIARLGLAVTAAASVACASDSLVAPDANPDGAPQLDVVALSVAGSYQLTLTLTTFGELILRSHVQEAASGAPAQSGAVTFQVCVRKGGHTLQMVPLASAECERGGSGTWGTLLRQTVDASGNAAMNFGIAPQFTIVGFRFKYSSQGGDIASGVSAPVDFVPGA